MATLNLLCAKLLRNHWALEGRMFETCRAIARKHRRGSMLRYQTKVVQQPTLESLGSLIVHRNLTNTWSRLFK